MAIPGCKGGWEETSQSMGSATPHVAPDQGSPSFKALACHLYTNAPESQLRPFLWDRGQGRSDLSAWASLGCCMWSTCLGWNSALSSSVRFLPCSLLFCKTISSRVRCYQEWKPKLGQRHFRASYRITSFILLVWTSWGTLPFGSARTRTSLIKLSPNISKIIL